MFLSQGYISSVREASGSPKSFVTRHGISNTIMYRERQAWKNGTSARQPGSYGNSLTGSEPGTEGRVQGSRDIIYGKSRKGRYGMVVHEWFDSTAVPMAERTPVAPLYPQGRFKATTIVVTTERHFQNVELRVLVQK